MKNQNIKESELSNSPRQVLSRNQLNSTIRSGEILIKTQEKEAQDWIKLAHEVVRM